MQLRKRREGKGREGTCKQIDHPSLIIKSHPSSTRHSATLFHAYHNPMVLLREPAKRIIRSVQLPRVDMPDHVGKGDGGQLQSEVAVDGLDAIKQFRLGYPTLHVCDAYCDLSLGVFSCDACYRLLSRMTSICRCNTLRQLTRH